MINYLSAWIPDTRTMISWAPLAQAVIGLVVLWQLWAAKQALRGSTQDQLYAHYRAISQLFVDKPHLRPYFYGNKGKPDSSPADRPGLINEIDAASEMILGLIEHAILQRKNLPGNAWKGCWRPYAKERLAKSEPIRTFYKDNKDWYAKALRKQIDSMLRPKETTWARVTRLANRIAPTRLRGWKPAVVDDLVKNRQNRKPNAA